MPQKRIHCLKSGCRRLVPQGRTKYCSPDCSYQYRYIEQQIRPKIDKICKLDQCKKMFKGNGLQKFCTPVHRIMHQYKLNNAVAEHMANFTHDCVCCNPPKRLAGREKYCKENLWMKNIVSVDKDDSKLTPEALAAQAKREEERKKTHDWVEDAQGKGTWVPKQSA